MQGISQSKHQHLVDALLQLENLLNRDFKQDTDKQHASELRSELEAMHRKYDEQMRELFDLILDYQDLFNKAKIQFLSPKLKELRKQVPQNTRLYTVLTENIQLAYGT